MEKPVASQPKLAVVIPSPASPWKPTTAAVLFVALLKSLVLLVDALSLLLFMKTTTRKILFRLRTLSHTVLELSLMILLLAPWLLILVSPESLLFKLSSLNLFVLNLLLLSTLFSLSLLAFLTLDRPLLVPRLLALRLLLFILGLLLFFDLEHLLATLSLFVLTVLFVDLNLFLFIPRRLPLILSLLVRNLLAPRPLFVLVVPFFELRPLILDLLALSFLVLSTLRLLVLLILSLPTPEPPRSLLLVRRRVLFALRPISLTLSLRLLALGGSSQTLDPKTMSDPMAPVQRPIPTRRTSTATPAEKTSRGLS